MCVIGIAIDVQIVFGLRRWPGPIDWIATRNVLNENERNDYYYFIGR